MRQGKLAGLVRDDRFLLAVTFGAACLAFLGPLVAYDLWWHLKAGSLILRTHAVPRADPFSFTAAGRPWTYHSWLSGVVLSAVWHVAGAEGLVLLRSFLVAGSLVAAWAAARRRGVGAGLAATLVLAACAQLKVRGLARPYLFSFLFFVTFAIVLREPARGEAGTARGYLWGRRGRLLLLPLLTALWANMHAGFISGLLVIGAFGAGEMAGLALGTPRSDRAGPGRLRSFAMRLASEPDGARFRAMLVAGALCVAASCATPYGPGVLTYPFRLMHEVRLVGRIQEWQPMPLRADFAIFWAMALVGGLILARSAWFCVRAGRLREGAGVLVTDALLMAGFGVLACQAVRHVAWFLLLAPSVMGYHLDACRWFGGGCERREEKPLYAYAACVVAAVVGFWPLLSEGRPRPVPSAKVLPVKACDYVQRQDLFERAYNSYEWGGYLIWRFWPRWKVFIDGRCLVYGDRIIQQALDVERGKGWRDIFDRWGVEMFLVRYRKRDSSHFFSDREWHCVYWDDVAIIGLRDDAFRARAPALREFPLSNPATFDRNVDELSPREALEELDAVLARDPDCWTALAFRARCLVRLAREEPDRKAELLAEAMRSAKRSLELCETESEPWTALREVADALGERELASRAGRRARALRRRRESAD